MEADLAFRIPNMTVNHIKDYDHLDKFPSERHRFMAI